MDDLIDGNHQDLAERCLYELYEASLGIGRQDGDVTIDSCGFTWLGHLRRSTDVLGPVEDWKIGVLKEVRPEENVGSNQHLNPIEVAQPEQGQEANRVDEAVLGSNLRIVVLDHGFGMALEDPVHKEVNEGEDGKDAAQQCD